MSMLDAKDVRLTAYWKGNDAYWGGLPRNNPIDSAEFPSAYKEWFQGYDEHPAEKG